MSADKWAVTNNEGSERSARIAASSKTKSRTVPFDPSAVPFDHTTHTAVELQPSDPLFALVASHLCKPGIVLDEDASSFQMARAEKSGQRKRSSCGRQDAAACGHQDAALSGVSVSLGLGFFRFLHGGVELKALHQHIGDPVGTGCGAAVMSSLVLFREGRGLAAAREIQAFLAEILAESERTSKSTFQVYRWHTKHRFWQRASRVVARPVSSVVLPEDTAGALARDLSDFLSEETSQFYLDHGIPYKRSYLFYGVPGSGKTSMIQALAGEFGRNLCYLSPTHPELDDDGLKSAIEKVPESAIVVLEDVDALFGKGREKKIHSSPLTFSGLLNALDGVGNHNGMVFVLTTNFKDQLDSALIRDGRVDVRTRFDYCTPDQMQRMFDNFYPPAAGATGGGGPPAAGQDADPEIAALEAKLAALRRAKAAVAGAGEAAGRAPSGADFRDALLLSLGDRQVSAAQLQAFFVAHRKSTPAEALADVAAVAAAIDRRKEEEAEKEPAKPAGEAADANGCGAAAPRGQRSRGSKGAEAGNGQGQTPGIGPQAVHVHVHTDPK